jgi:hypothetical protein
VGLLGDSLNHSLEKLHFTLDFLDFEIQMMLHRLLAAVDLFLIEFGE